jgi:3-hydroxyacyl-[acyl-carrier-protein] dehydratase
MNEMERQVLAAALAEPKRGSDGCVTQEFRFPEDFIGFQGHFPDRPMLPAVVQLMMIRAALRAAYGECGSVASIKSASFMRSILPLETVRVDCVPRDVAHAWQVELRVGDEVAAKAKLVFREGGRDRAHP